MTVEKSIKKLKIARFAFKPESEAFASINMAIRSLEAWGNVLDELKEYGSICVEYTAEGGMTEKEVDAVVDSVLKQAKQAVLEIISKHLEGVTE